MRRNKTPSIHDYIEMRMEDLKEEAAKCHDQYDRLWYNKIIAELYWVDMYITGGEESDSNCPLTEKELHEFDV